MRAFLIALGRTGKTQQLANKHRQNMFGSAIQVFAGLFTHRKGEVIGHRLFKFRHHRQHIREHLCRQPTHLRRHVIQPKHLRVNRTATHQVIRHLQQLMHKAHRHMVVPHAILIQSAKGPHHVFDRKARRHFTFVFELIKSPLPPAPMHNLQAFLFHQEGMGVVNAKVLGKLFKLFKVVVKSAAAFQFVYKTFLEVPRRAKLREIRKHRRQNMGIVPPFPKLEHRDTRRRHTVVHRQNPHQRRFARHIRFNRFRLVIFQVGNVQSVNLEKHKGVG